MQNVQSCNTTTPSILLIEPDLVGYSERAAQLQRANFCVTRADNPHGIDVLRGACPFFLAVLDSGVGFLALRALARVVRRQWHRARILVLGSVPSHFEDDLYNETVLHTSHEKTFLTMLATMTDDPRNQRMCRSPLWIDSMSLAWRMPQGQMVQESDPNGKASAEHRRSGFGRGWTVKEPFRQRP